MTKDDSAYLMLFGNVDDDDINTGKYYWLASSYALKLNYTYTMGLYTVYHGEVDGYYDPLWDEFGSKYFSSECPIRPVVVLKSNFKPVIAP